MFTKILIKILIFIFSFGFLQTLNGQLRYPIVGTFQKKSAQGMAIYEDFAYLMNDSGICRVLNLKNEKIIRHFCLASAAKGNHANTACFKKTPSGEGGMPMIYISECTGKGRCFVERFDTNTSPLIQTIEAIKDGKNCRISNWTLDNKRGFLYGIARNQKEILDSDGNVRCSIVKFRIPSLLEGAHVCFTESDIIDKFDVFFPNIMQGVKIRGNYMFLVTGQPQSLSERKDGRREIFVIDLKKKKIVKTIDLTYVTTNEPEDIDFYRGKCLLFCGHEGGIYEVDM